MTFSDFSITVSQNLVSSKMEESAKFASLFVTSNVELKVDPVTFII